QQMGNALGLGLVSVVFFGTMGDHLTPARVGPVGDAEVDVPVRRFGIPEQFLAHAKRAEVLADIGLTPVDVAGRISASLALAEPAVEEPGKPAVEQSGDGRIVMPAQGEN
ncbi:1-deoxy-D-xylulose-5-phosphate synthase, partial [Streptomyces tendae]